MSWTPTSHVCKAPFLGPRPVPYSIPFWGAVELFVEKRAIPPQPRVLGEDPGSVRKPGQRSICVQDAGTGKGKVGRQPGVEGGGPKDEEMAWS